MGRCASFCIQCSWHSTNSGMAGDESVRLLSLKIAQLAKDFETEGGFTERLHRTRPCYARLFCFVPRALVALPEHVEDSGN